MTFYFYYRFLNGMFVLAYPTIRSPRTQMRQHFFKTLSMFVVMFVCDICLPRRNTPDIKTMAHVVTETNILMIRSSEFECDKIFDSKIIKNGTITSPLYSESGFLTCRYEFKAEELERVQIKFFEFSLPKQTNRTDCENADILQLFLPQRSRYELEDTFCGSTIPKPIMSDGSLLLLKYMSRRIGKGTRGFKAEYRFLKNFGITTGEQLSNHCVFAYNSSVDKTGWLTSPNFPGFYPKNLKCNYYFFGQPGERVNIRFTYFDVEGIYPCAESTASDFVEFSNFMSIDRKFGRMCGKKDEISVRSDGRFFRISFYANDRFDKTGFRASYEFETKMVTTENTSLKSSLSTGSSKTLSGVLLSVVFLILSRTLSNGLVMKL